MKNAPEADFRTYRRDLPHWRAADEVQHVVWRLSKWQCPLTAEERQLIVNALRHFDGDRYILIACAVMDDHVHVVLNPGDSRLEKIVHSWKSYTAQVLSRRGRAAPIWQSEYYDRMIRSDTELDQTVAYVVHNPVERWPELKAYAWAWETDREI
jgi:REP element-mobilizing transposase RayT